MAAPDRGTKQCFAFDSGAATEGRPLRLKFLMWFGARRQCSRGAS